MAKRIVKRKRVKLIPFLIVIALATAISFGCYKFVTLPIKNIVIENTNYLNDDYIIKLAGIYDYPSFCLTNYSKLKKKLISSPYIEDVKIKLKFFNVLVIKVYEDKPLYIDNNRNMVIFEDKTSTLVDDNYIFRIPRLMNYVPNDKYSQFIKGMSRIEDDILGKISEIEYQPNDYDKDRFLLYMDDGNMVYLTLTKFRQINYYNDVLTQLEDRKGILYLDSGNHFQIKE